MMNTSEHSGETSGKGRENGDPSSETERPLKKARFAWQVKGKYHLKNELDKTSKTTTATNKSDKSGSSYTEPCSINKPADSEKNLEVIGNYLYTPDLNTSESVAGNSDMTENQYPRFLYHEYQSVDHNKTEKHITAKVTNLLEELCIAHWQAKQVGRAIVDNALNDALEYRLTPDQDEDRNNSVMYALSVADFVNNHPGDNSVENAGILMAISAHGLQNASNSSSDITDNNDTQISKKLQVTSSVKSKNNFSHIDEIDPPKSSNHSESLEPDDMSWHYNDESSSDTITFSYFPENSTCEHECFDDSRDLIPDAQYESDVLDAAVLFAIQSKGLTASGTDYG